MSKIISQFITDSAITTAKLNDEAVTTAKVGSGAITTAKIADSAVDSLQVNALAITTAKIASGAVTAAKLADGSVGNIAVASGIDAIKLADGSISNTEFQYLNGVTSAIQTQLDAKAPAAGPTFTGAIDGSASTNVDLATTNAASTVDIGTGTGANTINIGGANSTVNIIGSVNNQNVTNMNVADKLITINDGGAAASGGSSGIEVEEDGSATAYVQTSSDRNSWKLKAPNTNGITTLTPGASDSNVVLDTATQTLTNKTLTAPSTDVVTLDGQASAPSNPSSGFYKMYVDDTTQRLSLLDSAGTVTTVGSGSGTGINYITKPDAETNATTGWATYADAAGTSPVDGTGGSPNSTLTVSSSSPLRGTYSYLFTKNSGASRQGEGFSYAFTIDTADKGKVLAGSFDYSVVSGTFADDDLTVWIYDVTNATLIQPAPYKIKNHSLAAEKFFFEFQTSSSSTSYRLIFHVGVSTDSANVLKFDNFVLGPQAKLYGSPITDWVSYTPTITTGSGTMTNYTATGYWRRLGDSVQLTGRIEFTGAVGTWANPYFSLPSGMTIDTAKLASTTNVQPFGYGLAVDSGSNYYNLNLVYNSTTKIELTQINVAGTYASASAVSQAVPISFASAPNDSLNWTAMVPIVGWSSSVIMNNDADTRVVAAIVQGDAASATVGNPIIAPTVTYDSHGAYNASTGRYTCAVPGIYKIFGAGQSASAATTLTIYKDGSTYALAGNLDSNGEATFCGSVVCVAGSIIDLRPGGTVDFTNVVINIEKLSGPAQIAASETMAARYYNATATVTGTFSKITFSTKDYDTHGSYSSGVYTFSSSGLFDIEAQALVNGSFIASNYTGIAIYKNSTLYSERYYTYHATTSAAYEPVINDKIRCVAGDQVEIRILSSGTTPTIGSSNTRNYLTITRVGNY